MECFPFVLLTARSLEAPPAGTSFTEKSLPCPASGWTRGFTCRVAIVLSWPRGSSFRCLRAGAPPLSPSSTTVGSTVHAQCNRLVAELERGVTETGTQTADAPTAETLRDVRQALPRVVPHGRRTCNYGMRSESSEGCHQPFPPCSLVPSQAFLDVWEKNLPMSGFSALPPQPAHLY